MTDRTFPRVLHAVEDIELGKWPLVDALVAEIATNARGARDGEFDRAVEFLIANDCREYAPSSLRDLFILGRWVDSSSRDYEFRRYPVHLVRVARLKAKSDHAVALNILAEKSSFRKIEGRPSERRPKTPLDKIGKAMDFAWEVQEHFIEGWTPETDEERYWIVTLAEKLQRLGQIIEQQARGTAVEDFDRDEFFRELDEFKAANA